MQCCFKNGNKLYHDANGNGHLSRMVKVFEILAQTTLLRVRILAYDGSKWYVDPLLDVVKAHWELWMIEKWRLVRLQWNSGSILGKIHTLLKYLDFSNTR